MTRWRLPSHLKIAPRHRPVLAALALLAGAGILPTALSVPAGGSTPSWVRLGTTPRLPSDAASLSTLPDKSMLHVDVALRPRGGTALSTYAKDVSTPGSALYGHFLSKGQFASTFGASSSSIEAVQQSLRSAGLNAGTVSSNHLSIPVSATAAQLSKALSTNFREYRVAGGRVAYANTSAPSIPVGVAPYVQGVIGLDDLNSATPFGAAGGDSASDTGSGAPAAGATSNVGTRLCSTAVRDAHAYGSYTASELATAYGFSGLYRAGDLGAGQTVALLEYQGHDAADVAAYQSCSGTNAPVTTVNVDGGPGEDSSVSEADGDIEDVVGLAPEASVLVYQAPNSTTGWLDNWNAAVSDDIAKVISISWGMCELLSSPDFEAENTILEQAAVQGQTFLAAAGDSGSEDCLGPNNANDFRAVDDPGSQPFMTSVGGTQWAGAGGPTNETVWNDGVLHCSGASDCYGAGGGGISQNWTMPSYQADADPSLGVVGTDSSGAPCGASPGDYCREVPDVSALAGPYPYLFYIDGNWVPYGGTSFAAATWAALIALTNASSSCAGETVGFANPLLYEVAASSPGAFDEVTTGDNDITGASGHLYPASAGYNMAAGLGTPNATLLSTRLCAAGGAPDPVVISNPGSQTSYLDQTVSLQILASETAPAGALSYSALGVPPGLSVSASTGLVTGTATTSGSYVVVVTAKDPSGASDSTTFSWTVQQPTTAPQVSDETSSGGYWLAGSNGDVYSFGGAPFEGSVAGLGIRLSDIAGMASTPDRGGYWLVGSDGGVFAFGSAGSFGSVPGLGIRVSDIAGIASTPDSRGYWLIGSDGAVFSFGDAQFYGSMGGRSLDKPVVAIAPTPDGGGYWLVGSDGGVFGFGDAQFYGSMGGRSLDKPVVAIAPTPDGGGYWLVGSDGGVFGFGDAQFYGSMGGRSLDKPVVAMAPTPDGGGYWLVGSDGGVFGFGDAAYDGSTSGAHGSNDDIVGMAPSD